MPLVLTLRNPTAGMVADARFRMTGSDAVIGSAPDADWRMADAQGGVAARHCQIGARDGAWLIVDLGGLGTAVNGRRIARPERLGAGDRMTVGPFEIAVAIEAASAATDAGAGGAGALLAAMGLARDAVPAGDAEILTAAGALLRGLAAGVVTMLAARARAKAEMGAEATAFAFGGSNPFKVARDGDAALAALLGSPARGIMPASQAVADAFGDLEAHQAATLRAMQGAMAATLERFSPAAIRARADGRGLLSRVLPGAREAALWQAYEREFDGVARHSGDAFVEVFAREFREAYARLSAGGG